MNAGDVAVAAGSHISGLNTFVQNYNFSGSSMDALNATYNPAYGAIAHGYEAISGSGVSYYNSGNQLSGLQRAGSAGFAAVDVAATVAVAVTGANTVSAMRAPRTNIADEFLRRSADILGDGATIQRGSMSSDFTLRSANGTRQIRIDFSNPHGLQPHINIETFSPRNAFPGDYRMNMTGNIHVFPGGQ